ncbi:hypothetical protein CHS0354_026103 [Potamilus streckersoni]|uniref:Uncharacterized protein n=1 Tax=Potamilus streckersoni TaxID=2493646 RepID=A0AAE0VNM5_9BIVA|nr:hypothetical protein CHS0354_026103 [Potamilus streckersoni]
MSIFRAWSHFSSNIASDDDWAMYVGMTKHDMKALEIDANTLEELALDKSSWRYALITGLKADEDKLRLHADEKKISEEEETAPTQTRRNFKCSNSSKDCHSRDGLHSHRKRCTATKRDISHGRISIVSQD